MRFLYSIGCLFGFVALLAADGPADNIADKVRRIPPLPKDPVSAEVKGELQLGVNELGMEIEKLHIGLESHPDLQALLPDVQIFHNAVRYALAHDEIFDAKKEVPIARKLLEVGMERAKAFRTKPHPWTKQTGLVVRGYVSKIDGSVQPYGLVVPPDYTGTIPRRRLDIWCHGRGETLSELNFLNDRMNNPGQFTPPGAFVLHLYGRYCNANKFAGEIDCFEALEHVKKHYAIDEDRIVMRGFSMGGAAAWQFAVHYPDQWCAAAPGAGFSETAEFLNVFQNEKVQPTWYEKRLWHWYDCPDYAVNLFNLPTVAYSGENDRQKQAADVMARALKKEGIDLVHIIGPKTGHSYHPDAKKEIDRRLDEIVAKGRDRWPKHIKFQTYTLRYNRCYWLTIDAMEHHWERARVEADCAADRVTIKTDGVQALTVSFPPGQGPFDPTKPAVVVEIDRDRVIAPGLSTTQAWTVRLSRDDKGEWHAVKDADVGTLRKRHGLQGPIDDAFLDRFVMVRPTGKPVNAAVGKFVEREMEHAITHWRQQFRGEAPVKEDKEITNRDMVGTNLILWGDPSSNAVLELIADRLPIKWTKDGVVVGGETFDASHVPVLIYPNPMNPKKYVVLNSGFTFREYDYLNNARQVPKLPDWAVVDVTTPMTSRAAGKVVKAGFFDEKWELRATKD
jgi:dienelactone hydrolase